MDAKHAESEVQHGVDMFKKYVPEEIKVEVQSLKQNDVPAVMVLAEESRRMREMYKMYGQQMAAMADMFKDEYTMVVNSNNELVKKLEGADEETSKLICEQIYDLAMLSNKPLDSDRMTAFIQRSNKILCDILNK